MKREPDGRLGFTRQEVADGKMDRFIAVLRENNCEMRLWTDGYCWVVEYLTREQWVDGIRFHLVDLYEEAFNEIMEPDGNE